LVEEIAASIISILKENEATWEKENKEANLKAEQKRLIKLQEEEKKRIKEEQENQKKQKEIEETKNLEIIGKFESKMMNMKKILKKNK